MPTPRTPSHPRAPAWRWGLLGALGVLVSLSVGLAWGLGSARAVALWVGACAGWLALAWGVGAWLVRRRGRRLQALAAGRAGDGFGHFALALAPWGVDPRVTRTVYDAVQAELAPACPGFPLRATDRLDALGLDDEVLDMAVAPAICQRIGQPLEQDAGPRPSGPLLTVGDLVVHVNARVQASGAAAAGGVRCLPADRP